MVPVFRFGGAGTRASRSAVVAILLAVVLVAASCGGSNSTKAKKSIPGIKEFGLTEEQFADHVARVEALMAGCMRDAGFEYVPVDVKTIEAAQARVRRDPGLTRRTYKEKYGLAVTTRLDDPVRDIAEGPRNLRIFSALSPPEQLAYKRTLWGEDPKATFVFTMDEEDFSSTGGCTRKAVSQVFSPAQMKGTFVNPKDVLLDSDPRFQKARREWSACMKDRGYNYREDQDEIIDEYRDRLDELTDGDDPATLTGDRAEALKQLQKEEIQVSLADLECQIKYTDAVERKVEIEIFGQEVSG
jgi:hypothetical protein